MNLGLILSLTRQGGPSGEPLVRAEAPADNEWSLGSVWLSEPFDNGDPTPVVTVDLNAYAAANSVPVDTLVPWWTNLTTPMGYQAGWEPCVYLGEGIYALWYDRDARPSWFPLNGSNIGISVRPAGLSRSLVSTTRKGPVVLAEEPAAQPTNEVSPTLSAAPVVGASISAVPGEWADAGNVTTELRVNGVPVAQPYTILADDDGKTIAAVDIATNGPWTVEVASGGQTITYAAPVITGTLSDVSALVGDADPTRDAGALLTGAGGTWTVTGPGASIDAAGVVTIDTTLAASGTVTARYTNSGGVASVSFEAVVEPAGGGVTWTPAMLDEAVNFAVFTFRSADVTANGSNEITAIAPRFSRGGTYAVSFDHTGDADITAPADWDAANEALDLGAGVGSVAKLALPWTWQMRNPSGGTPGPTGGVACAIAATGMDGSFGGVPTQPGVWASNPADASGLPNLSIRGLGRNLGTFVPVDGFPTSAATIGYYDGNGQTAGQRVRLNGARRQNNVANTTDANTPATTFVIGAQADGTDGISGKVRMIAFFDRPLSDTDQLRFDAWVKFNVAGMDGVTLSDYDTVDGSSGTPALSALNDAEFIEGAPPQSTGNPLTDITGQEIITLYEDVPISPIRVKPLFFFGTSYEVTGLPDGLAYANGLITGTPTAAGTFNAVQITATNSSGSLARTFSITVAAAPATVTSEAELWAAAFGGTPGGSITIDNLGSIIADPTVLKASAVAGASVTLVGATDFRASALPTTNLDAEFRRYIPHTDSAGDAVNSAPSEAAHPLFGDDPRRRRFGPENAYTAPMDHAQIEGVWLPWGLKLYNSNANDMGAVAVRHRHEHDGHVLWAMRVRRADGSIETVYEEMDNTRAKNPRPAFRAALRTGSPATHLLSIATFQIASHAALTVNAVEDSADPRTWIMAGKRRRGDYTADATATDWADVSTKIAALTITGGQITDKASGARYVIQLPATVLKDGSTRAWARLSAAARTKLTEIRDQTDNAVFLVGVPGKTILPYFWAEDGTFIEMGWVTFARDVVEDFGGDDRSAVVFADTGAHVRCFGCVVDGLDGTSIVGGADRADQIDKPSIFEFYDGVISGVYNGAGFGKPTPATAGLTEAQWDALQPRIAIARSILAHGNDDMPAYGPGSARLEGNYMLGGGGGMHPNNGLLHRDIGVQANNANAAGKINLAHYNNFVHSGPAQLGDFANRAAETLYMLQSARMDAFDIVGNVYVTSGQRMNFRGDPKRRQPGATVYDNGNWQYRASISGNMFLPYPPLMTGASYPMLQADGVSGGIGGHEYWAGSDNLHLVADLDGSEGFGRTVNIFPEEVADADRASWLDAADAFASFPAISGTYSAGYTADWSGTTYAGTSREGYLAPADIEVAAALRTWGVGGGPNLPQHGAYLDNYLDLPADIYQHLGYVDAGGASLTDGLYPVDWFDQWTPGEVTLDATLADPWTAMPGDDAVDPKSILFNFKLGATVGSGLLFEEIDADGSKHVLGINADAKPYWTMYDTDGTTVLYHMTGGQAVSANSHVLVHPSTRYQGWQHESSFGRIAVQQMIHEHYVRDSETDELVHFYYSADTAPFSTNPAAITGVKQVHIWAKTSERNQIYVWNGTAWVWAHGALADIATNRFAWFARGNAIEDTPSGRILEHAGLEYRQSTLPFASARVIFKQVAPADIASTSLTFTGFSEGDLVWYARPSNEAPDAQPVVGRYNGTAWVLDSWSTPNSLTVRGEPHCWFRVDGKQSLREQDWVWSNQHPVMGVSIRNLTVAAETLPFDFLVKDVADLSVASQVWMVVADINSDSGWRAFIASGSRALNAEEWSVETGGIDNPAGGTIALEPLALVNSWQAFAERELITAYDSTAHVFAQNNPETQLYIRNSDGTYRTPDSGELEDVRAFVKLNIGEDRYAAYGIDHELPRGSVRLGADTSDPYTQNVRLFEARRFRGIIKKGNTGEMEANGVGIWHRLARYPVDPATGERDHPMLGAADVWAAGDSVPARMAAPGVTATSATAISVARAGAPLDGGAAISSYDLRHSTDETTWTTVTGISNPQAVTGLTASTEYYVQTRAVNSVGAGEWSVSASVTTEAQAMPVMTSAASVTRDEGAATLVLTLTASRPSTFAIGGTDAALFEIVSGNELHFVTAPDVSANTTYNITITPTAIDNSDEGSAQSVAVTVNDVPAGAAYTFRSHTYGSTGNSQTRTQTVDIGGASADRFVLVGTALAYENDAPTVTVGGVSLPLLHWSGTTGRVVGWFGAVLPTGSGEQDVVVTYITGATYRGLGIAVWTLTGLASTTPKQALSAVGAGPTVPVDAGDFLFALSESAAAYTGDITAPPATETPARQSKAGDDKSLSADWITSAGNGSFVLGYNFQTAVVGAITFA